MIYLALCVVFGIAGGLVGRMKGGSFLLWGLISAVFPVLGLVGAVLYRSERDELRRECPNCGKLCLLYEAMCLRCGQDLEFPDVAIESEAAAERAQRQIPAT